MHHHLPLFSKPSGRQQRACLLLLSVEFAEQAQALLQHRTARRIGLVTRLNRRFQAYLLLVAAGTEPSQTRGPKSARGAGWMSDDRQLQHIRNQLCPQRAARAAAGQAALGNLSLRIAQHRQSVRQAKRYAFNHRIAQQRTRRFVAQIEEGA